MKKSTDNLEKVCPYCKGNGQTGMGDCPMCDGSGQIGNLNLKQ